jgi:hypothetical protein
MMMKIYESQIAVLAAARASEYESRIVRFLRAHLPAAAERDHETLRREVGERIAEASAIGLDTELQIAAYVVGAWRFGDDLIARIEPLRPRLTDARVAPADKARLLLQVIDALSPP